VNESSNAGTGTGRGTAPEEVDRRTGDEPGYVGFSLDTVLGSIDPLPGTTSEDFDPEIEDAVADAADRRVRKMAMPRSSPSREGDAG
jgi:hypothetical protein